MLELGRGISGTLVQQGILNDRYQAARQGNANLLGEMLCCIKGTLDHCCFNLKCCFKLLGCNAIEATANVQVL